MVGGEECRGRVGRSEGTHDQLDVLQHPLGDAYSRRKQVFGTQALTLRLHHYSEL